MPVNILVPRETNTPTTPQFSKLSCEKNDDRGNYFTKQKHTLPLFIYRRSLCIT